MAYGPSALQQRTLSMKVSLSIFVCCLGLCLLGVPWSSAVGQDGLVVETVSFHKESGQKEKIRIKLNGPIIPKVYTMDGDNKPRLVIDLAGARYAGQGSPAIKGGDTLVKSIRVGVHKEPSAKVRVVLDLQPGRKYSYTTDFLKQENTLNVNLVPAAAAKTAPVAVVQIDAGVVKKMVKDEPAKTAVAAKSEGKQPVVEKKPAIITATQKKIEKEPAAEVKEPAKGTIAAPAGKQVVTLSEEQKVTNEIESIAGRLKALQQPVLEEKQDLPAEVKPAEKPEIKPAEKVEIKPQAKPEEKPEVQPEEPAVTEAAVKPQTAIAGDNKEEIEKKAAETKPAEPVDKVVSEEPTEKAAGQDVPSTAVPENKEGKEAAEEKPAEKQQTPVTEVPATATPLLLDVTYENNSSKGEMIFFHLNGFYPPNVSALEGKVPQVVCEFANMAKDDKIKPMIETRGAYVQKIETKVGKDQQIRVILSLTPHRDYDLRQVFFKEDNLFVLVVDTLSEGNGEKAVEQKK